MNEAEITLAKYQQTCGEYANKRDLYRRDLAKLRAARPREDWSEQEGIYRENLRFLERRAMGHRAKWLKLSGTEQEFLTVRMARQLKLPLARD